ncbi:hypothetical protein ACQKNN_27665 [Bacillus paramycoides]|uniref:hypothetical protein n=1 Tax=Bacillus paramycoides TaxID=2026194 RepID=UPI003D0424CE
MKKLLVVFFALALAFTAIGSTPAMAAGNYGTKLDFGDYYGNSLTNYVNNKKPLFNSPSDPRVVGYVADQWVKVKQPWFIIDTSLGAKWVGFNAGDYNTWWSLNHKKGTLSITSKVPIRNDPGSPAVGYVANQEVNARQAWYLISTSLGDKWIGYNF